MFFGISRLGLAAVAPALILAQSLTTYSITIDGEIRTFVLPTPKVLGVTTVFVTKPAVTVTSKVAGSVETKTFVVTGPPAEVSDLRPSLPESVGFVVPESPGPIVPIAINGFTTRIQLPASASIPSGPVTIPPVSIIAPTPPARSSVEKAAGSSAPEKSAAASKVAGKNQQGSEEPTRTPYNLVISGSIPIQVLPTTAGAETTSKSFVSGSIRSSKSSSVESSLRSSITVESSPSASKHSSRLGTTESARSSAEAVSASSTSSAAESGTRTTGTESVPTSLITETSPSPSSAPSTTSEGSSSTETATSVGPSDSGTSSTPPQASSTSAPSSGGHTHKVLCQTSTILAGIAVILMFF